MNNLLALLLLLTIVSANLRGTPDQAESTEVVMAQAPPQGSEKQNPDSNTNESVSFLDNKSQDQVHSGADYLKVLNENQRAFGIDDKIQQNQNNDLHQKIDEIRNNDLQQKIDERDDKIKQISNGEFKSLQDFEKYLNNLEQEYKKYQQSISDGDNQSQSEEINQENQQLSKQIEIEILKIKNIIQQMASEEQEMKQYISEFQQFKKDEQKKLYKQKILLQKADDIFWIENELNKKKEELNQSNLKLKQVKSEFNLIQNEVLYSGLVSKELFNEMENYNYDLKVRKRIKRTDSLKQYQLRLVKHLQHYEEVAKSIEYKYILLFQQKMFIKDIKDPTGMFSQIGRLTAEKFGQPRPKKKKLQIQSDDFDIFEEQIPEPDQSQKTQQKTEKKPIEPFSRSLSRERQRRERESEKTPPPGYYRPRYQSVEKQIIEQYKRRSTHILPFEAYQCRQNMRSTDLNSKAKMLIDYPKRKVKGSVELRKQTSRPRLRTQASEYSNSEIKKKQNTISFKHLTGHSLYQKVDSKAVQYDPKFEFVFRKTVYVGPPFDKLQDRVENIYKITCLNQDYDFSKGAPFLYPNTKKSVPNFNQINRTPNPELPAHMQKNGSRLQVETFTDFKI